jgi:parallel beta-helix repeat protein
MIKWDMHMQVHMHQDGMKLNKFLIVIVLMFMITNSVCLFNNFEPCKADTPPTIYVGPGETYTRIQDALDNITTDGYRIFVYNGTYYEHLIINYQIDLFGEDRSNTIIDGNGSNTVITVNANNVNISHFTIKNHNASVNSSLIHINEDHSIITDNILSQGYHGIFLDNSNNHLIYDNIIQNNAGDGIRLNRSNDNVNISFNTILRNRNGISFYSSQRDKLYNNEIKNNKQNGIFLNRTCQNNIIINNNVSKNGNHGIYLNDYSNHQTITSNQVYYNNNSGIVLENCSSNLYIDDNKVIGNTNYGIMIIGSANNVSGNIIAHNRKDGLYLSADNNNTLYQNSISFNTIAGIRLYNTTHDIIDNNEIFNNGAYGAYLDFFTMNNLIYNNYFHDNTRNAIDKSLNHNQWYTTKITKPNIIGGPKICGNYWDDYDELSEGAYDNDTDGIAEKPYTIYSLNTDNGPLLDTLKPSIEPVSIAPITQTIGKYSNISVIITDNTKLKGVYLNIIDPNGQQSNLSITQNKTGDTYFCLKQFSQTGNYSVNVTAKDPRNWAYSSKYNFSIRPGNPPTIVDHSPTTSQPSAKFIFNTTVSSKDALPSDLRVYVNWTHGDKHGNVSLVNIQGNYFVATIVLAASVANMTYHFYATDQWGNDVQTENKKVKITDVTPPVILIKRHGPSFGDLPNSFTFGATITDDSVASSVTIEYWYTNYSKMKVTMDAMGNNYYEKVIVPEETPDRVFCIINASDVAGNTVDTRNPIACQEGPHTGMVLQEITFNGTGSFDLDGTISNYSWNFGDGTTGKGSTITHTYSSNGNYTVTLTVKDNDGNNGTNLSSIHIISFVQHKIPIDQLDLINALYHLSLTEQVFCYDSDGNGVEDTFVDPNSVLTAVHGRPANLSGNIVFLLSIGNDSLPEFFWDTTTDLVFSLSHDIGVVENLVVDDPHQQAVMYVTVNKAQWIYFEVNDQYPNSPVTITTRGRTLSSGQFWREQQKIYVFDDPETEYQFSYESIFPPVTALFNPPDGGVINGDNPTIHITYNVPVTIITATFDATNIKSELLSVDNRNFTFTPAGYLENGSYALEIDAQALQGTGYLSSTTIYFYLAYELPPQQSFLEKNMGWILFGGFIGTLGALLMFFRVKHVTIDGFIYLKNRKIVPFFKSIIVGPISVRIPDKRLSKAEFYVDGRLKNETTSFPAVWQWNETAFMRHTLETKVYDSEGNNVSSGEMEFYIFNVTKK